MRLRSFLITALLALVAPMFAVAQQAVTITALAGLDPTHGGAVTCDTADGYVCNSNYGALKITIGTTPVASVDQFSITWATALLSSKPLIIFWSGINDAGATSIAFSEDPITTTPTGVYAGINASYTSTSSGSPGSTCTTFYQIIPSGTTPSFGLIGTIDSPDGTPFNGTLSVQVTRPTVVNTCTDPVQIVTLKPALFKIINGQIVNGTAAKFLTNSCLSPRIPYYAQMFDTTNRQVYTDNWYFPPINSSNIDVGTLQDVAFAAAGQTNSTSTPIIVAIPAAIVSTPGSSQTITQPGGTALSINNLTVTGTFALTGTVSLTSMTVGTLGVTTETVTTDNITNENLSGTLSMASGSGIKGLASAPSGSCSTVGWIPFPTGWAYCNGSTYSLLGTSDLGDWTNSGIANGDIPEWNATTGKWTPAVAPSGSFSAGGDLQGSSTVQEVSGILTKALPSLSLGALTYSGSAWAFTPLTTSALGDWTNSGIANGDIPQWNAGTSKWAAVPNPAGASPQSVTITSLAALGSGGTSTCETVCNSFHGDIKLVAGSGSTLGDCVSISWSTALGSRADVVITPVAPTGYDPNHFQLDGATTTTLKFTVGDQVSCGSQEFTYIVQPL